MKNFKRCLCFALCLVLLWLPFGSVAADAGEAPVQTDNKGNQNYAYDYYATPVRSYLNDNGDGTYTRVEFSNGQVTVERYNQALEFIDGKTIEPELPLFGGYYSGSDSNFLIVGQENPNEDGSVEVIRVIRYSKDWERVGSASLFGANTTIPFRASSLRCAEYNGYLYIHTGHQMYTSDDGKNHQANMTLNLRIRDMVITDSFYTVTYYCGYVSHSFNQFISTDEGKLVTVDHGDAYPRSVFLQRYRNPAGHDEFLGGKPAGVNVLNINGALGANATGVSLGGFEVSDRAYLIAGNTVSQGDDYDTAGQRNIFVAATGKDDFTAQGTKLTYLTQYTGEDQVALSNPQFTKISSDRFIILWTETQNDTATLHWAFVDGNGDLIGSVYSGYGSLSDCKPIVSDNRLIWYVTVESEPCFFVMDLNNPETVTHEHSLVYDYAYHIEDDWYIIFHEPTYTEPGELSRRCIFCDGENGTVTIPPVQGSEEYALDALYAPASCLRNGYASYVWTRAEEYGLPPLYLDVMIPATGHSYEVSLVPATCTKDGYSHHVCLSCGDSYRDSYVSATGHSYTPVTTAPGCTEPGFTLYTCHCGDSYRGDPVAATGHSYTSQVIAPTCTEDGYTTYTCHCGHSYQDGYTPATGHDYQGGFYCVSCGEKSPTNARLTGNCTSFGTGTAVLELFHPGQNQPLLTLETDYNNCTYTMSNLIPGDYTLTVRKPGHVTREYAITLQDGDNFLDLKIHLLGDVTGDGRVNISDTAKLYSHVRQSLTITDEYTLLCADMTGDGRINVSDVGRLYSYVKGTKK